MTTKDLHNNIKVTPCIAPAAAVTANGVTTGASIDTRGYESLEFVVQSGVITDGQHAISMEHGDLADNSDMAAVDSADLIGSLPTILATEDGVCERVGYRGSKTYARIKSTQSGATSGGFLAAVAVQSHARVRPVP